MYLIPRSINKRKFFELTTYTATTSSRILINKNTSTKTKNNKMNNNNNGWNGSGGGSGLNGRNNWNQNKYDNSLHSATNNLISLMSLPFVSNSLRMNPPPPPPMIINCGELRKTDEGKFVEITGRFVKKRLGRFAELRDRHGATQLVICEDKTPRIARRFANMPVDSTLTIVGNVLLRPFNSRNNSMPTGDVEVEVEEIVNIERPTVRRATGKRSYSTMAESKNLGITSTEYKIAKNENILKYFDNRKITCNDLRLQHVGKIVNLVGWIPTFTNSKFQQLKDGYGQTQIIVDNKNDFELIQCLSPTTIIQVKGKVLARPSCNVNTKYDTGEIELFVDEIKVINPDEPYDGPVKEKVAKMSIDDCDTKMDDEGDVRKTEVDKKIDKIADTNKFTTRTHNCGELNSSQVGKKVVICGWLEFQRMRKFLVLRDGYGQTQVLLSDEIEGLSDQLDNIPFESIVQVDGTVIPRPSNMINQFMKTGEVEVLATSIKVLNAATKNLPFDVRSHNRAKENLRLEHRYIDLRFSDMQWNLRTRSTILMKMREYLINYLGFVEVETPTLFRRTPGGAQEFIVPTRKPGHFYSLVQSPQQFKQMLMAGAIDRYFQIARCYRDEATRPDRQPEFTQLDIELSFTTSDDIINLIEETLRFCWPKEIGKLEVPFPRITYDKAMSLYGSDKPDTRFQLLLNDVSTLIQKNEDINKNYPNLGAYAIVAKKQMSFLNGAAKRQFEQLGKDFQGKLFFKKLTAKPKECIDKLANLVGEDIAKSVGIELNLEADDMFFLAYGRKHEVQTLMGRVRLTYADILEENDLLPKRRNLHNFLWVVDFPLFSYNEETNEMESTHHPFTAPHGNDLENLKQKKDLMELRSQAYDLVLNGQEIGGGSIRIHDKELQQFVLEDVLKIEHDHLQHLLSALSSGCPPHGGIALGIDRFIAIICKAKSIRDVIAFPKGLEGKDPLSKAPILISEEEKRLYNIDIRTQNGLGNLLKDEPNKNEN